MLKRLWLQPDGSGKYLSHRVVTETFHFFPHALCLPFSWSITFVVMYSLAFLTLFFSSTWALPTDTLPVHRRCGAVSQFYGQTPTDWQTNKVDDWLNTWVTNHTTDISGNSFGFAGAFGQWAIGNPDVSNFWSFLLSFLAAWGMLQMSPNPETFEYCFCMETFLE